MVSPPGWPATQSWWLVRRPWSPLRVPAFWMLLAVIAASALVVALVALLMLFSTPRASALTFPLVFVYLAGWLTMLLRLADPVERRPAWVVAVAVAWGATVACVIGAAAVTFMDNLVGKAVSPSFAASWSAALSAPTVEETAKGAGVILLLLAARPYLVTVWSGAVYGGLIGVGFAAVEDVGYALSYADMALPDDVMAAWQVLLLRFTTPGLVGHPLFSATLGAGIGYVWLRADRSRARRFAVLVGSFAGAWTMHFMVNSPLAAGAAGLLGRFGWGAGWAGFVLATTVPAVPAVWWLMALRRADASMLLNRAATLAPALIPVADIAVLTQARARRREERQVHGTHGRRAIHAVRRLRRAQLRLAATLIRPYRGYPPATPYWLAPPVRECCREVDEAQAEVARQERDPSALPPTDEV